MMKVAIILCLVGVALCKPVKDKRPERVSYRGHKLFSVTVETALEAEFLRELQNDPDLALDFWKQPHKGDIHIHVSPKVEKKFTKTLQRAGLKYKVVENDIQRIIDDELESLAKNAGSRNFRQTYLPLPEVEQVLVALQAEFPQRVQLFEMGNSIEGNTVWGVKISTDLAGSGKKAVWVETGTHAREFITISVALGTIDNLARLYGGTGAEAQKATAMLELYDWYFVPVHNPDGYDYAYNTDRMWRKNRRSINMFCTGVDLNRNWNSNHGGSGSSSNACSDTYHGGSALSEPETKALDTAVKNTPNVVAFISLHSYSQYILLPWGYTSTKPSDYNTLRNIALSAQTELESYYRTRYVVGTPPDILYVASGGAYDHMKLNNGIKYAYTYELRPASGSSFGFELPTSQIAPTIIETFASLWKFAEEIYADDNAAGRK